MKIKINRISVIIPIYNASKYLRECLETVLSQTYSDLEVILVDDGSNDGSSEICDEIEAIDQRIKVIHQINAGPSAARNAGLKAATGTYIGFVDADDMVETDMYEMLISTAIVSNADIVSSGVRIRSLDGQEVRESIIKHVQKMNREEALEALLTSRLNVAVYSKLFEKDILTEIMFREDKLYAEDKFFVFQAILKADNIIVIPESKYIYIKHDASATTSVISKKNFDAFELAVETKRQISKYYKKLIPAAEYNLIYTIELLMRRLENEKMNKKLAVEKMQCLRALKSTHIAAVWRFGSFKEVIEYCVLKYMYPLYGLYRTIIYQLKRRFIQ